MSMWRHNGVKWESVDWGRIRVMGRAVICGSGHGLPEYRENPSDFKICINAAWRVIHPDIWIGLDQPEYFGPELFKQAFRKVVRGTFCESQVGDLPVKSHPETYFADCVAMPIQDILLNRGSNFNLIWCKDSMIPAIQLAIWMGFRDLAFAGVNLGGAHCDGRKFTPEQDADNIKLWGQIEGRLRTIVDIGGQLGYRFQSLTKDSPINNFMESA